MDWLVYITLLGQALIAFPVLWFLAYVIGNGFSAGSATALAARVRQFILLNKKNEKDIL